MMSGIVGFDTIISGNNFCYRDEFGHSQGSFHADLPQMRQEPDPIAELENLYNDIGVQMRAEKLLKEVLGEGSYMEFIQAHQITIASKLYENRYYTIREFGYVQVIDNGVITEELCLVPKEGNLALQDVVALKKLMLEGEEKKFLEIANHFSKGVPSERLSSVRRAFRRRFGGN